MRTLVIVNPRSGSSSDLSRVASLIRRHPAMADPEIRITGESGDGRLLARAGVDHAFERMFAVGGDGTFNEVLNGVLDRIPADGQTDGTTRPVLGLLPLGTGNDLARSLGLPLDLEEALDVVEACVPRATDVVRVGGGVERYFINASAGGFSGDVDRKVTEERKRSWGPLAYLRGALDVLPDPERYRARVEMSDGRKVELDVVNLVVANGRSVAGGIPVAPEARLDDGLLEIVAVRAASLSALAGFGSRCLLGKHLEHELVLYARSRCVKVWSEPAMTFNLDGELSGPTPLDYRAVPRAIRLLGLPDAPGYGRTLDAPAPGTQGSPSDQRSPP